jgi:hypothetical protein
LADNIYWTKPKRIRAAQLRWETWADFKELAGDRIQRINLMDMKYPTETMEQHLPGIEVEIYLSTFGDLTVIHNEWLVESDGQFHRYTDEEFNNLYEKRRLDEVLKDEALSLGQRWLERISHEIEQIEQGKEYEVRKIRISQSILNHLYGLIGEDYFLPYPNQKTKIEVGYSDGGIFTNDGGFIELEYYRIGKSKNGKASGTRGIMV